MPNLESAKKNLRKSRRRQKEAWIIMAKIHKLIKTKGADKRKTQSAVDKASKRRIFHKNKAARLISRLK